MTRRGEIAIAGGRESRTQDPPPECETLGRFMMWVRRRYSLSQRELGKVVARSANAIGLYERDCRRPPATVILDLLDGLPVPNVSFNDVASWYRYRPVESLDPWSYDSIHAYVAGVRVYRGYGRVAFAATLGCRPDQVRAVEHRDKPDGEFLHRLVKRHVRPECSYGRLRARFRTLRPSPDDQRLRELFAQLRRREVGSAEHRELRDQLIVEHVDLAREIASRMRHHRVPSNEAVQLASEALVRAVDRCDPRFGDFVPYLRKWVRGTICQFARLGCVSGSNTAIGGHGGAVARAVREFGRENGRDPTVKEIQARVSLPREAIEETLQALVARNTVSMDKPDSRTGLTIGETISDRSDISAEVACSASVQGLLARLDADQREIVVMHFLDDLAVEDIAARTGRSPSEIGGLLADALRVLRLTLPPPLVT